MSDFIDETLFNQKANKEVSLIYYGNRGKQNTIYKS